MKDIFKNTFYQDTVDIVKITESSGYTKTRNRLVIATISVDVQPYKYNNDGLDNTLRGYVENCDFKMFYNDCDDVKVGNYVHYNDTDYLIAYTESRALGCMALLRNEG